ncbi:MAG: SDR family oxidoreductase [Burkholderiales bacterium]|nr:SDR family oxidoreductase [Burkholderiales bacterium]
MGAAWPTTPSFRLDGRAALVAGGGRGLGAAAALALADAGAHVTVAARSRAELDAVVAEARRRGGRAEALVLDVTDAAAVAREVGARGPFPILVNSAGTNRPALLTETPQADIDLLLDLNVRAALTLAREVARGLVAARLPGSIITISSQMGHVGAPRRAVYCATKHAVEGMTRALAWELGPAGIRVNTVCPTFVETAMTAPMFADPAFRADVVSRIALGRIGRTDDIMGAVVYLAGDAAALVTGSALMVDGGWTAA